MEGQVMGFRTLFAIAGITCLVWTTSCTSSRLSTQSEDAKEAFQSGRSLEKQSNTLKAIAAYSKAVLLDPAFFEAYVALGDLYERLGNYGKAYENFGKALILTVERTPLYFKYGRSLFNAGRYEDAYTYLEMYHRLNPQDLQGLEWLAETARVLKKSSAEDYLIELTTSDSTNSAAWLSLARLYYDMGAFDKAIPAFRKYSLCEQGPLDGATGLEYAECLVREARWAEIEVVLERIGESSSLLVDLRQCIRWIQQDSFDAGVLVLYFDARRYMNSPSFEEDGQSYQGVYRLLDEAIRREPGFMPLYEELASVSYAMGRDSVAMKAYEKLDLVGRATAADYLNLGYLYFKADDLINARRYYQASLDMDRTQKSVEDYLVTIQKLLDGKIRKDAYHAYDRGVQAASTDTTEFYLRQAIRLDSTYYEAYLQLGSTLMKSGRNKEAERIFDRGLLAATDSVIMNYFLYQMGLNYYQMDFHDKAIKAFQMLLDRDSTDGDALSYLAKTYAEKSDIGRAVATHDRLVRLVPSYFKADQQDLQSAGLTFGIQEDTTKTLKYYGMLAVGQTNTYRLRIKSKNNALLDGDDGGDVSRELEIVFREQVIDLTEYGEAEMALDILKVQGYQVPAREKRFEGRRLYLRMSDLYGVTNIYGLMEDNPYSLPRLIVWVMEGMHGSFLRKRLVEGETWRSPQHVFKLGSVDGVSVFTDIAATTAEGSKYYGILGSYDAARYGEVGRVTVHNKGQIEFEMDLSRNLIRSYFNQFTTRSFHEADAKLEVQEGSCRVELLSSTVEKIDKPRKYVLENVPYVKQHGPQCAAASLSMILSYYGTHIDQDEVYAAIRSDYAGAQSLDILHYPRSLGQYKTYGYVGTLEDLKSRIDQGIPMMVFLTPFGYGHVVVVIGYDETRHQIIMHDPTVANHQAVPYDEFLQEWRQSGNECAMVVPFDREITLSEHPLATYEAVETKWQGDKAMGELQYDKALSLYQNALQKYSSYEGALEGAMLVHLAKDEFAQAEVILDTLLTLNPTSIDLILKRASLLLSQYDYDKVLQLTRKAKQLDESNIINYIYTASALFSQKKYEDAIREIKEAIRINPLQSTPRNMLAGFLAETNDFDQAYEQVRLSIRYEPENAGNYITLSGVCLAEIANRFVVGGRRQELVTKALQATDQIKAYNANFPNLDQLYADIYAAGEWRHLSDSLYRENIRKFPEENSAYNNFAWHLACDGRDLEEARRLSEKSIELSQRNPYYFDTLAWIHLKMGLQHVASSRRDSADFYFAQAERELLATIEYDRYSDFAYRHLGVVYLSAGRPYDAEAQFGAASSMVPDQGRVWTDIAKDCEEVHLHDSALSYYLRALNHKPNLSFAAYRAAHLMATASDSVAEAMNLISVAEAQEPDNALFIGTRGVVLFKAGDLPGARSSLEKAVELAHSLPDEQRAVHHYYLALVYRQLKESSLSRTHLEAYLSIAPDGALANEARRLLRSGKK